MSLELIKIIALLCQIQPTKIGLTMADVDEYQLNCQKHYVNCIEESRKSEKDAIRECIQSRQVNQPLPSTRIKE